MPPAHVKLYASSCQCMYVCLCMMEAWMLMHPNALPWVPFGCHAEHSLCLSEMGEGSRPCMCACVCVAAWWLVQSTQTDSWIPAVSGGKTGQEEEQDVGQRLLNSRYKLDEQNRRIEMKPVILFRFCLPNPFSCEGGDQHEREDEGKRRPQLILQA